MFCPKDESNLESINEKIGGFQCPKCDGILCINEKMASKVKGEGVSTSKIKPFSYLELHCPKCKSIMENLTLNGVSIDACLMCNVVWFDKGEIEKINEKLSPEEMEKLKEVKWDVTPFHVIAHVLGGNRWWYR